MAVAPRHGGPAMFDPEDRPRSPQQPNSTAGCPAPSSISRVRCASSTYCARSAPVRAAVSSRYASRRCGRCV